jgi:hypothetical protein
MLVPVRQLYPIRLESPAETRSFVLETNLPVAPILQPKMFFRNISATDSVRVQLNHVLSLGISDDPLLSGTFTTQLFDEIVGPGELLWHVFPAVSLSEGIVYHEVTVSISGAVSDVILQSWIEGVFEESLKSAPEFEPIVI